MKDYSLRKSIPSSGVTFIPQITHLHETASGLGYERKAYSYPAKPAKTHDLIPNKLSTSLKILIMVA
jgi:hypothetical protein